MKTFTFNYTYKGQSGFFSGDFNKISEAFAAVTSLNPGLTLKSISGGTVNGVAI